MKFVILGFDGPDGVAKRRLYRPAHLAKLDVLHAQQRVILAGPLMDGAGSLIVISADSLAEAEALAKEDPYTVHGVFERIEVHPFAQVLPKENTSGRTERGSPKIKAPIRAHSIAIAAYLRSLNWFVLRQ
jgi:uncharacterized protein